MAFDWKRFAEESYARKTPEERARIDAYRAREARLDETAAEITGHFQTLGRRRPAPARIDLRSLSRGGVSARGRAGKELETVVEREWEAPLKVRIEDVGDHEIIRFHGAVTGHEAYTLDESFASMVAGETDWTFEEGVRIFICGGTAGRYDACWVDRREVEAYLRERRPSLFGDAAPRP